MKSFFNILAITLSSSLVFLNPSKAEDLQPFERMTARIPVGCAGSKPSPDGYNVMEIIDCKTDERLPSGFRFNDGPGHPYLSGVTSQYPDGGKPVRNIEFESRDGAFNETNLYLEDLAGGPDTDDMKSVVLLLPRLGVPEVYVENNDVIMTLTTGEKVVFDKKSHGIVSGVLIEGPIDLTTNGSKRQPPNVHYTGVGISIRVDHRSLYPTQAPVKAEIKQGTNICKISKSFIWNKDGDLITTNDMSLLKTINKKCPTPFHL